MPVRPAVRSLGARLLFGGLVGGVVLGIGGRIVMRALSLINDTATMLSPSGTTTVVLSGVASGVAGALLHLLAGSIGRRAAPEHPWVRRAIFGILLLLITLRGLHPVQPVALALFAPLVILYGIAIESAAVRAEGRAHDTRLLP